MQGDPLIDCEPTASQAIAAFSHASIPQIQSAIKFGGDKSARIQFDVPASEMDQIANLVQNGAGSALILTVHLSNSTVLGG